MTNTRKGRPRRNEPAYPEDAVDALLVYGETAQHQRTGLACQRYPSIREIAKRYGVSHTTIAEYSKRKNCMARREEIQARVRAKADERLADVRAHAVAVSQEDVVKIVDDVFAAFRENLKANKIRFDSVRDLTLILELRKSLQATAAAEDGAPVGLSLDELQATHRSVLAKPATSALQGGNVETSAPPDAEIRNLREGTGNP